MNKVAYKIIPGWGGFYRIGTDGSVWSCKRHGRWTRLKGGWVKDRKGGKRYPTVILSDGQRRACRTVPRMMWELFRGTIPPDKEINHKNGNKADPSLNNLELLTRPENVEHAVRTGLCPAKEKHGRAVFTEELVRLIRDRYSKGETQASIARSLGRHQSHISQIVRGVIW